jgi:hypothetical protein
MAAAGGWPATERQKLLKPQLLFDQFGRVADLSNDFLQLRGRDTQVPAPVPDLVVVAHVDLASIGLDRVDLASRHGAFPLFRRQRFEEESSSILTSGNPSTALILIVECPGGEFVEPNVK